VRKTTTLFFNCQEAKMDALCHIDIDFYAKLPDELFTVPVAWASVPRRP
jgi:hypothetical protein